MPATEVVTQLPVLAPRRAASNKGDFGRVLVVAGSQGMSGAAILCASAALRAGAGLVYLATPDSVQPVAAAANPCYLTIALSQDDHGRLNEGAEADILLQAKRNDVVALGPGIGTSDALSKMIPTLLDRIQAPVVLDADGLNALEDNTEHLKERRPPLIMTPHPGEFARF